MTRTTSLLLQPACLRSSRLVARTLTLLLAALLFVACTAQAQVPLPASRFADMPSTAGFTLGLSLIDSPGLTTTALTTDQVRITGTIAPEPEQLGQQADIFVVARVGDFFYMRTQSGAFVLWDGVVSRLVPYMPAQTLTPHIEVDFLTGNVPVPGNHRLFIGYRAADGVLVYTYRPLEISITEGTGTAPTLRPYINLSDFGGASPTSPAYTRYFSMVNRWVSGIRSEYNYSPTHSVIAYALTGDDKYIESAIADVNSYVEAQITSACSASRTAPSIGGDSYLGAGAAIEDIALTYDHGFHLLTDTQRSRWLALMTQVANNIWGIPSQATWGGPAMGCNAKTVSWSGWAIYPPYGPNPGNNYYHASFARVAMLLALTTRDPQWLDLVQQKIIPALTDYFATKVPDGGSREGTGYGASHRSLFDLYRVWLASTGEDLAHRSPHARNTINYWLHATVPTLDKLIPIGDQARVSEPVIYDYHRTIMLEAQLLSPNTAEAAWANWWLANTSLSRMSSGFNSQFDLLKRVAEPQKPTQLSYYAQGAGVYFARSSWEKDATHFSLIAGQFEESHAGQEQGNFSFFKQGWLAVTSNIWSHSGIVQTTDSRNVLRFDNASGGIIPQDRYADNLAPVLLHSTDADGTRRGSVDLSVAYAKNKAQVQSWRRDFAYKDDRLTIHDTCQVAPTITPVWQVHVPSRPLVNTATGNITTADGKLLITPMMAVAPRIVVDEMRDINTDYAAGKFRISLYSNSGCDFTVSLQAL